MGWNRRDDGSNDHPKIRGLGSWEPDLLWQKAGVGCSKAKTGGIIAPADLELFGFLAYLRTQAKLRSAARKLVEAKLWHDHQTVNDCPRCVNVLADADVELGPGWFMFHDWEDCNPSKKAEDDSVTKFKEQRRRRLREMVSLKADIIARDGEWCRYCACRTRYIKGDQRSNDRRVLDHVDPMGENTLGNLVVACGRCNGRKRDRLPSEAGMPLLAPPASSSEPPQPYPDGYTPEDASDPGPRATPINAVSTTDQRQTDAGTAPNDVEIGAENTAEQRRPSRDARDGPGVEGIRSGVDPGAGLASVGPGLAGLVRTGAGVVGLGPAGPGLAGEGSAGSGAAPGQMQATTRGSDG